MMTKRVRYWDLAASVAMSADYTAGVKMSLHDGIYYIEDVRHGRWSPYDRDRIILQTAQLDGVECEVLIEQEPGSAGKSVVDALVKLLAGFVVHGHKPTGNKEVRALPFASQCQAGNVKLVTGDWIEDYLLELEAFPIGSHDDRVDASSGAFNYLSAPTTWVHDANVIEWLKQRARPENPAEKPADTSKVASAPPTPAPPAPSSTPLAPPPANSAAVSAVSTSPPEVKPNGHPFLVPPPASLHVP